MEFVAVSCCQNTHTSLTSLSFPSQFLLHQAQISSPGPSKSHEFKRCVWSYSHSLISSFLGFYLQSEPQFSDTCPIQPWKPHTGIRRWRHTNPGCDLPLTHSLPVAWMFPIMLLLQYKIIHLSWTACFSPAKRFAGEEGCGVWSGGSSGSPIWSKQLCPNGMPPTWAEEKGLKYFVLTSVNTYNYVSWLFACPPVILTSSFGVQPWVIHPHVLQIITLTRVSLDWALWSESGVRHYLCLSPNTMHY